MPAPAVSLLSRASTATVAPRERVEFWEEHNRRALVGLSCSPYAADGLHATQTNLRFGRLQLADIAGNEHVIERTAHTCQRLPKDSVFASLVLRGDGVFYHGQGCLTLRPGDLALYDTRRSYLFGFTSGMRQLLVDIPAEVFREQCDPAGVPIPRLFCGSSDTDGPLLAALRATLEGLTLPLNAPPTPADLPPSGPPGDTMAAPGPPPSPQPPAQAALSGCPEDTTLGLLRTLVTVHTERPTAPPPLAVALHHVEAHLGDPTLTVARVAAAAGLSERHLTRLFTTVGSTPHRHIQHRRLDEAYRELTCPPDPSGTVSALAHRWGFASHAHFTRAFRARYGCAPSETRVRRHVPRRTSGNAQLPTKRGV